MAIKHSVGEKASNDKVDVKVIQAALNQVHSSRFTLEHKLLVDGDNGKKTITAINDFQKHIVRLNLPDGRVDAGGTTLKTLRKNINKGLSQDALMAVMAMGSSSTISIYLDLMLTAFPTYHIDTPLRMAHFLAQIGHESLSFVYTQEIASGAAYEGRKDLGNIHKGDGVRFKGRGLLQLTGRDNYASYSQYKKVDFLQSGNEELIATTPEYALDVSLWFWMKRKLNKYADGDKLKAITRRVNGGYNGLADRADYLERAKFFLLP